MSKTALCRHWVAVLLQRMNRVMHDLLLFVVGQANVPRELRSVACALEKTEPACTVRAEQEDVALAPERRIDGYVHEGHVRFTHFCGQSGGDAMDRIAAEENMVCAQSCRLRVASIARARISSTSPRRKCLVRSGMVGSDNNSIRGVSCSGTPRYDR